MNINNLIQIKMNLEITKDAAIKAHQNAKSSGKQLLEHLFGKKTFQLNVMERVQNFDDACKELGIEVPTFTEPTNSDDRAVIAFQKLTIIIRALNEGWTPNWGDFDEYKYYAWFKFQKSSNASSGVGFSYHDWALSLTNTLVGSRLCFHSKELAIYAGQQFKELYKDYLTL